MERITSVTAERFVLLSVRLEFALELSDTVVLLCLVMVFLVCFQVEKGIINQNHYHGCFISACFWRSVTDCSVFRQTEQKKQISGMMN